MYVYLSEEQVDTIVYCIGITRGTVAKGWLSEADDELREQFKLEAQEYNEKLNAILDVLERSGQA